MSNRTDFANAAKEIVDAAIAGDWTVGQYVDRIETELHDAYVAGEEGNGCMCSSCIKLTEDEKLDKSWWLLTKLGLDAQEVQAMDPEVRRKLTKRLAPMLVREIL